VIAIGAVLAFILITDNSKDKADKNDASVSDTTDTNTTDNSGGGSLEKYDQDYYTENNLTVPTDTTNL
jgi:hypothetical protein